MQIKHLYRVYLTYPESWHVSISASLGTEIYHFFWLKDVAKAGSMAASEA